LANRFLRISARFEKKKKGEGKLEDDPVRGAKGKIPLLESFIAGIQKRKKREKIEVAHVFVACSGEGKGGRGKGSSALSPLVLRVGEGREGKGWLIRPSLNRRERKKERGREVARTVFDWLDPRVERKGTHPEVVRDLVSFRNWK